MTQQASLIRLGLVIIMNTRSEDVVLLQIEFYDPGCVAQAISDFREYLSGNSVPMSDEIRVDLSLNPSYANEKVRILRELLNYALDLSLKTRFSHEA